MSGLIPETHVSNVNSVALTVLEYEHLTPKISGSHDPDEAPFLKNI